MNTIKSYACYCLSVMLVLQSDIALAAEAVVQAPAAIDYQSQLGRVLGVLLLLLIGIFIVVWVMKKIGYTGNVASGMLSVKACLSLSNKDKLYVVQVGEEQLLIGVNQGAITPLKTLDKPINSEKSLATASNQFSKKLHAIISQNIADTEK